MNDFALLLGCETPDQTRVEWTVNLVTIDATGQGMHSIALKFELGETHL